MTHFYIGTTNEHKIREIGGILSSTGFTFEPTDPVDPEETEGDFEKNAILKARVYSEYSGGMTICEDSGLVVPALNNLPGPWSARFSDCRIDRSNMKVVGYHSSGISREEIDTKNNYLVLRLMENIHQPYRAAFFVVSLVVSTPEKILFKSTGKSHGWISEEIRGSNGFGYDPIFVGSDTFGKTYAELDSMRKNLRSHRFKVLNEFKSWLAYNFG